mmetsp:Transcript_44529/g.43182  ORF Transcript_44529/g.43182 Transcript_44529/m.43182 type:complete len:185 (-) Transcript_44529:361-915(-)
MKLMEHRNRQLQTKFKDLVDITIKSYEGKELGQVDKRLLRGILERKSFEDKKKDTMIEAMKNMLLGGLTNEPEEGTGEKTTNKPKPVGGFAAMFSKYKEEAEQELKVKDRKTIMGIQLPTQETTEDLPKKTEGISGFSLLKGLAPKKQNFIDEKTLEKEEPEEEKKEDWEEKWPGGLPDSPPKL